MEGVGSRPEAEGWMEGGGIGLKAPWEIITIKLLSGNLDPKMVSSGFS